MATQDEQEKLNAALDAALDELDDDDNEIFQDTLSCPDENNDADDTSAKFSQNQSASRPPSKNIPSLSKNEATAPSPAFIGPPRPPSFQQSEITPEKFLDDMMKELSNVESDAEMGDLMGRFLQEMQTQIKSEIAQLETASPSPTKTSKGSSATPRKVSNTTSPGKEEVDAVISNLVEDMTKQASLVDQEEIKTKSTGTAGEDEMLNSFMKDFANLGNGEADAEDFDADAVIDGMMEHLLSKDLMYEPMKQVATRFPSWLEEKRCVLSKKEFAEYVCTFSISSLFDFVCAVLVCSHTPFT
jgi:peroxin-19